MSIIDHPDAQALLADAILTPEAVQGCQDRLAAFRARSLPHCYRAEHRTHADLVLRGLVSGRPRKTCAPIAVEAGVQRTPIQTFVGSAKWDDEDVRAALRRHGRAELADPPALLILDPSAVPKTGTESCGVARQWGGRLGQPDHCPLGVCLADAAPGGYAPWDRRRYLPKEWAADAERRATGQVPKEVTFQEAWRSAAELRKRGRKDLPHAWVTGADELGRPALFRAGLRRHGERSVRDVPCNTNIRDLDCRRPRRRHAGRGRKREGAFGRVAPWAARQPESRWPRLTIRDGERGPLPIAALTVRVRTQEERRIGPEERLVVRRTVAAKPRIDYARSTAGPEVPLIELVRVRFARHRIEAVVEASKRAAGRAHSEVRSWVGWHHHITLSLRALWFLILERRRVGGKPPGRNGVAGAGDLHAPVAGPGPEPRADCTGGDTGVVAEGSGADLQMVQGNWEIPAPPITAGYELNACSAV